MSDDLDARKPMRLESFKLTDADSADLTALADGQSKGALIRHWIRQAKQHLAPSLLARAKKKVRRVIAVVASVARPPPDPELIRQLAKVGNLLNQIAKGLHVCRHNGAAIDLTLVYFAMALIDDHLDYLRENYAIAPQAPDAASDDEEHL